MAKTNPVEFLREVREEANKITWPSRKETMVTKKSRFLSYCTTSEKKMS